MVNFGLFLKLASFLATTFHIISNCAEEKARGCYFFRITEEVKRTYTATCFNMDSISSSCAEAGKTIGVVTITHVILEYTIGITVIFAIILCPLRYLCRPPLIRVQAVHFEVGNASAGFSTSSPTSHPSIPTTLPPSRSSDLVGN